MIVEPARAKLNLALHVRTRREDGYHELETLFAFTEFGDEVRLSDAEIPSFAVTGPFAEALARESDNLVTRAAEAFSAAFGPLPPLRTELVKRLPVASGIGGGSADAAAMLRALAQRTGIDPAALADIAPKLGSDVPACLLGRTAIGRGRGERLEPVGGLQGAPVLLVNPGVAVATREVFVRWDGLDRGPLPVGDASVIASEGRNDLEPPARAVAPVIGEVLELLAAQPGMLLARMSGSGGTCFALCADAAARSHAAATVQAARPGWWCLETVLS
ncbi:4-(cytidine 5'-diphospho)-2-C-methyl-D-erythritol kinase [Sphingomonas sp. DT-204]|uniref:4-(cytidine 5'-diphospho)-2-C-methyl-D-erythritol kinase n=1 Tax=Sphingomonas sp. DT-204 TaxID=3396166 RepID=UPI003F1D2AC7